MITKPLLHAVASALRDAESPVVEVRSISQDDATTLSQRLTHALGSNHCVVTLADANLPPGGITLAISSALEAPEGGDSKRRLRRALSERASAGQHTTVSVPLAERLPFDSLNLLLQLAQDPAHALSLLLLRTTQERHAGTSHTKILSFDAQEAAFQEPSPSLEKPTPKPPLLPQSSSRRFDRRAIGIAFLGLIALLVGILWQPTLTTPESMPSSKAPASRAEPGPNTSVFETPQKAPEKTTAPASPAEAEPPKHTPLAEPIAPSSPVEDPPPKPAPNPPVSLITQKEPLSAPLHINAHPWARIEIDGAEFGETPLGNIRLSPGKHRVRASYEDGRVLDVEIVTGEAESYLSLAAP